MTENANKNLIILGMHRSCSSLITQWLQACGLQVGNRLLSADPTNPDGYFEDIEFVRIHQEILNNAGLDGSGLKKPMQVVPNIYDKAKLEAIIGIKNNCYKQWGWKDPRTCLLLHTYTSLLPAAKYLIIYRNHKAVVSSLLKRDFFFIEQKYLSRNWFSRLVWQYLRKDRQKERLYKEKATGYLNAWIVYYKVMLDLISVLSEDRYIITNYSLLKESDEQLYDILANRWGFQLNYKNFVGIFKENLISPVTNVFPYIDNIVVDEADKLHHYFEGLLTLSWRG